MADKEMFTEDNKQYHIREIKGKGEGRETLAFDVKCRNDAHIALLSSDSITNPMIEVFIGGWNNKKSAIRLNGTKPDKVEELTSDIVSAEEYRRFWITFQNQLIQVGTEGDVIPFLSWENKDEPFKVTHIGFATGWGSTGAWIIDDEESLSSSEDEDVEKIRQRGKKPFYKRPCVWLDVIEGHIPLRSVVAGADSHGEKIYVGRVKQNGFLLPGKIVPSHNCCYVAYDGVEVGSSKYQILVKNKHCELIWVPTDNGQVPFGALQGGFTKEESLVFIGRLAHEGATLIGTVHPSQGNCSATFDGQEIVQENYEVLVVKYLPL